MVKGNNLLLNGYEWLIRINQRFAALKKPFEKYRKAFWVIEGARTPDPQNHNLML